MACVANFFDSLGEGKSVFKEKFCQELVHGSFSFILDRTYYCLNKQNQEA